MNTVADIPSYERGSAVLEAKAEQEDQLISVQYVEVTDGYENKNKGRRHMVQATMNGFESYLVNHPDANVDSPENKARDWFNKMATMRSWKDMMPSAMALYPLQRPEERQLPNGAPIDAFSRQVFRHSIDAIGIRTRAKIMEGLMVEHVNGSDDENIKWVSLACGAAVPVLDALQAIDETSPEKDVHLTLVDINPEALDFAETLADHQGLTKDKDYSIEEANLIREMIISDEFVRRHGEESYDAVDMLGIFEYFDEKRSAAMLKNAYRLLKPGGKLIIGNMLTTHPNIQFNQRAIGWPGIKPRSIEEISAIISNADIDTAQAEGYVPQDGVYVVVAIEKPKLEVVSTLTRDHIIGATALRG